VISDRRYAYIEDCFDKQTNFIYDQSKDKSLLKGRRAGGSDTGSRYMVYVAESRPSNVLYITLTRPTAKRIMWTKLNKLKKRYALEWESNTSELTCTFGNGSIIYLAGANNEAEIEKFRGEAYDLIIIDEPASFGPYIAELVTDVIDPTRLDSDGTVCMIGSPNAACSGYFHDVTTGVEDGWSVHHWTVLDNPFIPHAKDWLEKYIAKRNWTWDHPVVRREWMAEWIRSMDSMVYRFSEDRNILREDFEPENYIIGGDLGFNDATAFVVWGYREDSKYIKTVEIFKKVGMLTHEVARELKRLQQKYSPMKTVVDTGGLGKMIVESIKHEHGVQIEPAEKRNKHDYIEDMNSHFDRGFIKVSPEHKQYISQLKVLQWDEQRRKEDERYENDVCDAALYGWREAKNWAMVTEEKPLSIDSEEYMDLMEEQEAEEMERRNTDPDGWMLDI